MKKFNDVLTKITEQEYDDFDDLISELSSHFNSFQKRGVRLNPFAMSRFRKKWMKAIIKYLKSSKYSSEDNRDLKWFKLFEKNIKSYDAESKKRLRIYRGKLYILFLYLERVDPPDGLFNNFKEFEHYIMHVKEEGAKNNIPIPPKRTTSKKPKPKPRK